MGSKNRGNEVDLGVDPEEQPVGTKKGEFSLALDGGKEELHGGE